MVIANIFDPDDLLNRAFRCHFSVENSTLSGLLNSLDESPGTFSKILHMDDAQLRPSTEVRQFIEVCLHNPYHLFKLNAPGQGCPDNNTGALGRLDHILQHHIQSVFLLRFVKVSWFRVYARFAIEHGWISSSAPWEDPSALMRELGTQKVDSFVNSIIRTPSPQAIQRIRGLVTAGSRYDYLCRGHQLSFGYSGTEGWEQELLETELFSLRKYLHSIGIKQLAESFRGGSCLLHQLAGRIVQDHMRLIGFPAEDSKSGLPHGQVRDQQSKSWKDHGRPYEVTGPRKFVLQTPKREQATSHGGTVQVADLGQPDRVPECSYQQTIARYIDQLSQIPPAEHDQRPRMTKRLRSPSTSTISSIDSMSSSLLEKHSEERRPTKSLKSDMNASVPTFQMVQAEQDRLKAILPYPQVNNTNEARAVQQVSKSDGSVRLPPLKDDLRRPSMLEHRYLPPVGNCQPRHGTKCQSTGSTYSFRGITSPRLSHFIQPRALPHTPPSSPSVFSTPTMQQDDPQSTNSCTSTSPAKDLPGGAMDLGSEQPEPTNPVLSPTTKGTASSSRKPLSGSPPISPSTHKRTASDPSKYAAIPVLSDIEEEESDDDSKGKNQLKE
ncbi:MAG: hypothetical protein Q9222_000910 [Ikaeria aurantiellina]